MSDQEIKINLCYYDPENPNSNLDAYEDEDRPQPRTEGCCCDNCFYGRDKLAMQLIEAKRECDEEREKAHRFRSLYYARSGIDKSASWFPWETSLNLAQKAQLLATEKHAK